MRKSVLLGWFLSGLLMASLVQAESAVEITEWKVPYEDSMPRDPWVGGPDLIWFVGQTDDYVGSLKPSTGEFKRYDLPEGAGPHTEIGRASCRERVCQYV